MPWDGSPKALDQLYQTQTWRSLFQQFIEFLAPEASHIILEVGVKTGRFSSALAQEVQEVQGVEPNPELLAIAERTIKNNRLENVILEEGSLEDLVFADGTFDSCCAFLVLHELENPTAVLQEMTRVTRTGGWIACINPSPLMNTESVERFLKESMSSHLVSDAMLSLAKTAESQARFSEDDLGEMFGAIGSYEIEVESAFSDLYFLARARAT